MYGVRRMNNMLFRYLSKDQLLRKVNGKVATSMPGGMSRGLFCVAFCSEKLTNLTEKSLVVRIFRNSWREGLVSMACVIGYLCRIHSVGLLKPLNP